MEDIHGLKPLMKLSFPWFPFIFLMVCVIGVFLLIGWLFIRKRQRSPSVQDPPVFSISFKEMALNELKSLSVWIERGDSERFYKELIKILRDYLQARYGKPVTTFTTIQIQALLTEHSPASWQAFSLDGLLYRSLLAGFAEKSIAQKNMLADYRLLSDFICDDFSKKEA